MGTLAADSWKSLVSQATGPAGASSRRRLTDAPFAPSALSPGTRPADREGRAHDLGLGLSPSCPRHPSLPVCPARHSGPWCCPPRPVIARQPPRRANAVGLGSLPRTRGHRGHPTAPARAGSWGACWPPCANSSVGGSLVVCEVGPCRVCYRKVVRKKGHHQPPAVVTRPARWP